MLYDLVEPSGKIPPWDPKMSSVNDPLLVVEAGMGKLFQDRRRFLVISVFDLCLITILWLLCTVIKGSDWPSIFLKEINIFEPNFLKLSMFDIVITAIIRVFILVFCYAILLVNHWLPVALTTLTTTTFLVIKVLFFFSYNPSGLPQYLVVLFSLIIAWFELWLVPFHILPRERRQLVVPLETPSSSHPINPKSTTDDEFRSALEASSGSDDSDYEAPHLSSGKIYSKAEYIEAVKEAEGIARGYMNDVQNWKVIVSDDPEIRFCEQSRIYYLRMEARCSPSSLFKAVWKENSFWNKKVLEFKVVLHIDDSTELCYTLTAPAMYRYIASRDFLDIRRAFIDSEREIYEGVVTSVDSSILPANSNKKVVRGFNGPSMMRMSRSVNDESMSVYEWIMNSDLKGDLPRRLVERGTSSFLLEYARSLRKFLTDNAYTHQ
uniref:START domain-containing protein n=1 Tax=Syphacia muris TaxID=451379 RepID=A0A0N5ASL1_9BILA